MSVSWFIQIGMNQISAKTWNNEDILDRKIWKGKNNIKKWVNLENTDQCIGNWSFFEEWTTPGLIHDKGQSWTIEKKDFQSIIVISHRDLVDNKINLPSQINDILERKNIMFLSAKKKFKDS